MFYVKIFLGCFINFENIKLFWLIFLDIKSDLVYFKDYLNSQLTIVGGEMSS